MSVSNCSLHYIFTIYYDQHYINLKWTLFSSLIQICCDILFNKIIFPIGFPCLPWQLQTNILAANHWCIGHYTYMFVCQSVCAFLYVCASALTTPSTSSALAHSLINNPCVYWMGLQRSIAVYCNVVFVWPWSQWFLGDGSIINLQLIHGANLTFTATPRTEGEPERERRKPGENSRKGQGKRQKREGGGGGERV